MSTNASKWIDESKPTLKVAFMKQVRQYLFSTQKPVLAYNFI